MVRRRLVLALSLGAPLVLLVPFSASGESPAPRTAKAADAGEHYDPDNVTAISQFMELVVKGNEKYMAKDLTAAVDLYKKAISLNPKNPLGHYVLGEAQLAMNNMSEAEAAFTQAVEVSDSKDPVLRSHVLFVMADFYERTKKWEKAREAWQTYGEHALKVPDGGAFPGSGAARLKAVDDWIKLQKNYELVRQRIAAEKDAGADAGKDAGKTPAKK